MSIVQITAKRTEILRLTQTIAKKQRKMHKHSKDKQLCEKLNERINALYPILMQREDELKTLEGIDAE